MWTTVNNEAALGSSIKLTTSGMKSYTIAAILEKQSEGHKAIDVSAALQKKYLERFGLEVMELVSNVTSDTTASAANVAGLLGADQDDCEFHVLSLILAYSAGAKDNTRTTTTVDENNNKVKTRSIVTKGGAFPEGKEAILASKGLVSYFTKSPQRQTELGKIRAQFTLPAIKLSNPPDTRAAYLITMFRSIIGNNFLLDKFKGTCDEFDNLWNKLTNDQKRVMQEVEAVCKSIVDYTLGMAQSSNDTNSHLLTFYRTMVRDVIKRKYFMVMKLERQSLDVTLGTWPREKRKVEEFTAGGKKCLERLKHQLEDRLDTPTPLKCLAVLLDPVTKFFSEALLKEKANLFEETVALLREKHRELYCMIETKKNENSGDTVAAGNESEEDLELEEPSAPKNDNDDDEEEDDGGVLNLKAKIAPAKNRNEEGQGGAFDLKLEADKSFDKWMEEKPTWNDYLKEGAEAINTDGDGNAGLVELIAKFDTQKYYREYATKTFPAISLLARIHFSRMDNGAFQERVFSVAGNAQSNNQGRMNFDHMEQRTLLQANKELIREGII